MFFLRHPSGTKDPGGERRQKQNPKGLRFSGLWCNWQHYGFWYRHSRFESW